MTHVIIKFWFSANQTANAPKNLLDVYKELVLWRRFDRPLANAVIDRLQRHLYLLSEETTPFSLAATNVSPQEKAEIAQALMHQPRGHLHPGVPAMPELTPTTTLASRIGPQSWHFFEAMKIGKTI
jgi:hypothetical protein